MAPVQWALTYPGELGQAVLLGISVGASGVLTWSRVLDLWERIGSLLPLIVLGGGCSRPVAEPRAELGAGRGGRGRGSGWGPIPGRARARPAPLVA